MEAPLLMASFQNSSSVLTLWTASRKLKVDMRGAPSWISGLAEKK